MGADKPWVIIQHASFEGPGLIEEIGSGCGVEFRTVRTFAGDGLPDWREVGGVVSMGGPMGVRDADEVTGMEAEMGLLWVAVDQDLPVLGVCLGAQLLAAALGARVTPGEHPEYGCGTVSLTKDGSDDPVLGPAGPTVPVLHWHQDTFSVPDDGVRLASSLMFRNQAFRVGTRVYGFQFHVELTPELVEGFRPHLPFGAAVPDGERDVIAETGRGILTRFFEIARRP